MRSFSAYRIAALADVWHTLGNGIEHRLCVDILSNLTTPNPTYVDGRMTVVCNNRLTDLGGISAVRSESR